MNSFFESGGVLFAVVAAHVFALITVLWAPHPKPVVDLPTIQGVLIPAPPAEVVQKISVKKKTYRVKKKDKKIVKKHKKKTIKKIKKTLPIHRDATVSRQIIDDVIETKDVSEEPVIMPSPVVSHQENNAQGAPILPPKMDANPLNNPAPAYPKLSRRLDEQGVVTLEVLILKDGSVGAVRLKQSSGFSRLDKTAIKAIKRWRYVPARQGKETIEYWYIQKLAFTLNS